MSILNKGKSLEYVIDYKNGNISKGRGIQCRLDDYYLFKRGELVLLCGFDNTGKTFFLFWYFINLILRYDLKVIIWTGENKPGQVMRDLIQFYAGEHIEKISDAKALRLGSLLENNIEFIENNKLYKPGELLELFADSDADICLIDPFTGLDREFTYDGNYKFLNQSREFCNKTGKTLYVTTHPNTEAGRSGNLYPENHIFKGHLKAPLRSNIEGGLAWCNRADAVLILHRLVKHESMKFETMLNVEKIKDTASGGKCTDFDTPLLFSYNYGLGFLSEGKDPLKDLRRETQKTLNI